MEYTVQSISILGRSLKALVTAVLDHSSSLRITHLPLENHLAHLVINICILSESKDSKHLKDTVIQMYYIFRDLSGQDDTDLSSLQHAAVEEGDEDAASSVDCWLRLLELAADAALCVLGPPAGLSPSQISAAERHLHALIDTVQGLEHGDVEAQAGAERLVRLMVLLLADIGVNTHIPRSDTPTGLDTALDLLRATLDGVLEVWGPRHHLSPYTISLLEVDLASVEQRLRDTEHGRLPLTDGLLAVVDEVFNMLRDCGVPVMRSEDVPVSLEQAARDLQDHLVALRAIINSQRDAPVALPTPSRDPITKLRCDITALGGGNGVVTLDEIVYNMHEVLREFAHVLD